MKFELGAKQEQAHNDQIRNEGGKLSWWEEYREFNRSEIEQLLAIRAQHGQDFADRLALQFKALKAAEENGDLVYKKRP